MGLPGLGTLLLHRQAAYFADDNATIIPPSYKLNFKSDKLENSSLPQAVQNDLEHLSNLINEDLSKYGRSKIKNLGTFTKEAENINFTSDPNFESSYTIGLKTIPNVRVADKIFTGSKEAVVSTETLITKKASKSSSELNQGLKNVLLYLLYGAIAAGILYALFNIKIPTSKNIESKPKPIDTLVQNKVTEDTSYHETSAISDTNIANSKNRDTIIVKPIIEAQNETKVTKSDPAISEFSEPKSNAVQSKTDHNKTANAKASGTAKATSSVKNLGSKKGSSSEDKENDSPNKFEKSKLEKRDGRPCVIVTGSFSKSTNIAKMVKHLQSKGYKVYTENLGELTRVGVEHTCSAGSNIDSIVETIKSQINSDAWILENN
jgi:cell division septation protein DedD